MSSGKWAVVGLGFIYPRHKQAIDSVGGNVVLTCDNDPQKNAMFLDYKEMVQDPRWEKVSHVAICAPNYLHTEMIKTFEGKTIICEKPLALKSQELKSLPKASTVLQLRYHPEVIRLKNSEIKPGAASLVVKVKRDKEYWNSWKGEEKKSGGILFNLGVHYFDLLIHLFGNTYEVKHSHYSEKLAWGKIDFGGMLVDYYLEIMDTNEGQDRKLVINGEEISLSKQDNLSFEDLHTKVYEDVLRGRGISVREAAKSIKLIEKLR